jgi:hypothetical protein
MRRVALLFVCLAGSLALAQTTPTAGEIMARVAINQDKAEKLRQEYVYQQHVHAISSMTNGRLMREVTDDYDVMPTPEGSKKQLKSRTGKYYQKGKYIDIKGESESKDDDSLDEDLTDGFIKDLVNEKSKDGLAGHLFPLTTAEQKNYKFQLIGAAEQDGRAVYRVGFSPAAHDEYAWAGEALIDKDDFQPVLVFTKLNKKLPLLIRGALGTDVPGVGFSVHYRRQPDGVWFPVSFGTEFRLKVLFLMKRNIVLSLENKNFQHTHVDSKITVPGSD